MFQPSTQGTWYLHVHPAAVCRVHITDEVRRCLPCPHLSSLFTCQCFPFGIIFSCFLCFPQKRLYGVASQPFALPTPSRSFPRPPTVFLVLPAGAVDARRSSNIGIVGNAMFTNNSVSKDGGESKRPSRIAWHYVHVTTTLSGSIAK